MSLRRYDSAPVRLHSRRGRGSTGMVFVLLEARTVVGTSGSRCDYLQESRVVCAKPDPSWTPVSRICVFCLSLWTMAEPESGSRSTDRYRTEGHLMKRFGFRHPLPPFHGSHLLSPKSDGSRVWCLSIAVSANMLFRISKGGGQLAAMITLRRPRNGGDEALSS